MTEHESDETNQPGEAPLDSRDPDEVLAPPPFRDPGDFAPLPTPRATFGDLLELAWHILFVLCVTVAAPLAILWVIYRLYRWLPMETMALAIAGLAAAWAYRDRIGDLLKRILVGRDKRQG